MSAAGYRMHYFLRGAPRWHEEMSDETRVALETVESGYLPSAGDLVLGDPGTYVVTKRIYDPTEDTFHIHGTFAGCVEHDWKCQDPAWIQRMDAQNPPGEGVAP